MIIGLLTHRLTGFFGAGAAIVLAVALGWQTMQLAGARNALKAVKVDLVTVKADLRTCQTNRAVLTDAIAARNAEIGRQKAESDRRAADLAKARQSAEKEAQRADRAAAKLAGFRPTGSDVCARLLAVDEAVKGSL